MKTRRIVETRHCLKPGDTVVISGLIKPRPWWVPRFIWRWWASRPNNQVMRKVLATTETTFTIEE